MKNVLKLLFLSVIFLMASCEKEPVSEGPTAVNVSANASPAANKGDQSIAGIVLSYANAEAEEDRQFTL